MNNINNTTPFSIVYDNFLSKITDDMYMELNELDTFRILEDLLITAINKFEFPRVNINDYEIQGMVDEGTYCGVESDNIECTVYIYDDVHFNTALTFEEINIISTYMIVEWIGQQLASVENTRMKYSGSDFKFTSQANHMAKLKVLKESYTQQGFHLQRLYKRRKRGKNGLMLSTMGQIMEEPSYGYKI